MILILDWTLTFIRRNLVSFMSALSFLSRSSYPFVVYFQISFFSTSPTLSNRERFPYFMRTIPSDVYQAEVMVALVKKLGWKYVSVIYEESSYGMFVSMIFVYLYVFRSV